jgi:hypothetical protein
MQREQGKNIETAKEATSVEKRKCFNSKFFNRNSKSKEGME